MRLSSVVRQFGRVAVLSMLASSVLVSLASQAEARRRAKAGYSPPYASIVVDAKTGKVLQATNPDAPRHPASVTKVMTLYMLFEAMERGRFSLDSELKISAHAARQAPSKLGLQPGETISVEDAIKAVVTKSANDVAAAIGENVGGSEERFAELMTEKARALGMRGTTFINASGLPDREQITTARDLALLGRAIQDRFPKYYHFFGTRVFNYDGYAYRNHNKLLGRVEGVDGIKTGYTRASGFNLLTSAKADGRHVITVVLGGKSGRVRDQQVAALVDEHLPRAYAGARQIPRIVEVASAETEDRPAARSQQVAQAAP
ncbi:MAG TPA: D-alanyl-D-alanine carboxypeptidase family protein, partial [Beijerinckiaceae bacterium]|nr:D-alanyl-D-alanine carboxypeptidase family protein [Beijerinckiaceae bacterium]